MQFTTEVNWTLIDFVALSTTLRHKPPMQFVLRKVSTSYRIVICVVFADNSSLIWGTRRWYSTHQLAVRRN
jgi:hypothetical protein